MAKVQIKSEKLTHFVFFDYLLNKQLSLRLIEDQQPLIHNITNYVAMNFVANCLLAIGASPMNPYYASQEDERHGWHCHHTIVEIACIVNTLRDKLEAEQ